MVGDELKQEIVMKKFASTPRPQWSEWDAIQEAEEVLPGIWSVSTASHGGLILSGERQEAMPEALRIEGRPLRGGRQLVACPSRIRR